ncbi:hypothetical protein [Ascidiaceihabitans sp.]|uniref:hypothetical protein n=1 Tax=Ascidiaceihabitans sp. TaxID=1872644 RepID=UPI00329732AD
MPTPSTEQIKVWACLTALVLAGLGATAWVADSLRMKEMRLNVRSHPSTPAIMTLIHNDVIALETSVKGRGDSRSMLFDGPFSTRLRFDLTWLDIEAKRGYRAKFEVDAKTISSFGGKGKRGSLSIIAGPGADVLVETPNAEALRIIGLGLDVDLSKYHTEDVVLARICATEISLDDPLVGGVEAIVSEQDLQTAKRNSISYLRQNPPYVPFCAND